MANVAWWGADSWTLRRVLSDQLYSELGRLRLGSPSGPPPWLWTDDTLIGGEDAGIDSLDLLSLSAAVAEVLPETGICAATSNRFGDWCDAVIPGVSCRPSHIAFRSSGSTGAPKRTTHCLGRLEQEAAAFAGLIGNRRRVLSAIPAHHAYGFIHSVLVPRHLPGLSDTLKVVELRGCAVSHIVSTLRPGDLVLGHPVFWDAILRGTTSRLPPDIVGVTSSAPCAAETAHGVRAAGLFRLLQVYGSAETAGIGWRDDPADPYTLLPGWQRDDAGLRHNQQPVPAPDRLAWDGNQFHVLGRRDGVVQVAGVNVSPEQVGLVLARHPAVAAIAVRVMRPDEGHRLKAFVVPTGTINGPEALHAELRRFAGANLSPAERPGAYSFGRALPHNAMGKPADWVSSEPETSQLVVK